MIDSSAPAVGDATDGALRDPPWRTVLPGCLAVAVVGLGLRLVYLVEVRRSPFYGLYLGDALVFHRWAQALAAGDWLGREVFFQAPLYPYLLGVLYRLAGDGPLAVHLLQAVMGAAACGLLAAAGWLFFGRRVGLLAGLGLALYPPSIFLEGLIQKSALDLLLTGALLVALGLLARRPTVRRWLAAGLLLGLLVLSRENALILAAVLLAWLWLGWRGRPATVAPAGAGTAAGGSATVAMPAAAIPRRMRWAWTAGLAAGLGLVLLPVALRNQVVGGEWALTTSNLGVNFYIGNNPQANGTYAPLQLGRGSAVVERADAARLAEAVVGRDLSAGGVSRYWLGQGLAYAQAQPAAWLRLQWRKLALVLGRDEVADTEAQGAYADYSLILAAGGLGTHFGLLLPLSVAGMILAPASRPRLASPERTAKSPGSACDPLAVHPPIGVLYALVVVYVLSVTLFFVFARFRLPLVPLLLLFAAAAVVALAEALVARRLSRRLVVAAAATAVVAVWANRSRYDAVSAKALTYANAGTTYAAANRDEAARILLQRAVALNPRSAVAQKDLGRVLMRSGHVEDALRHFQMATDLRPDYAEAYYYLGQAQAEAGQNVAAIGALEHAVRLDPANAEAYNALGVALAKAGRIGEAMVQFSRAVELAPDFAAARQNLERARQLQAAPAPP
jgi:tetratricopeptide (TPR) repeat protein